MDLLETVFDDQTYSLATYAYDEQGRRVDTIRRTGKLSEEQVTIRYDDFNNPVEEVRSGVDREMRMGRWGGEERGRAISRATSQIRVSVRRIRKLDRADRLAANGTDRRRAALEHRAADH
jgi:hypothetical protein